MYGNIKNSETSNHNSLSGRFSMPVSEGVSNQNSLWCCVWRYSSLDKFTALDSSSVITDIDKTWTKATFYTKEFIHRKLI